jgi:hypothetical protein
MNFNLQDSLYIHLFEAYLNSYLPFWGTVPISPRFIRLKEDQMKLGSKHTGSYVLINVALFIVDISKSTFSVHKSRQNEVLETPSEKFVEVCTYYVCRRGT